MVPDTVGTKGDASQFGVRIRCAPRLQSSTCHQGLRARMRSRGRLGEPGRRARGAIQNTSTETRRRSQKDRCHTQRHRRSNFCVLCVLLWMQCRFARCQNMRRIESHHHVTTTRRRFIRGVPLLGSRRAIDRTCQSMRAADGQAVTLPRVETQHCLSVSESLGTSRATDRQAVAHT